MAITITHGSYHERRVAVARESDTRQESVIEAAKSGGFSIDWPAILADISSAHDPVAAIERALADQLEGRDFIRTFDAIEANGRLLAAYIHRKNEEAAGIASASPRVVFAEPSTFTPEQALARWRKILGLTDQQAAALLADLRSFHKIIRGEISAAVMTEVERIYEQTIAEGLAESEFLKLARAKLPDFSDALLETHMRTTLTDVFTGALDDQIKERPNTFPFMQFMALLDSGTTWWICRPMGTAGPGRTGWIAATNDPGWRKWRAPLHWRCRSSISPIGYREAQRLGILAADGKTKIAIIGSNPNRPFGDPPKFAEDPDTGTLRRVEPAPGFGGE